MAIVQRRRSRPIGQAMSIAQFLDLPERKPYLELEDGVVTCKVSPKGEHSSLQGGLFALAAALIAPAKHGRVFPELRVTFGGQSRVPDLSIYRWDRIERKANSEVATDFVSPPDVTIEILSPGQSVTKLMTRCLWYVSNGVQAALLVHERQRTIVVFHTGEQPRSLRDIDRIDLSAVIAGLSFTVTDVFATLRID